VNTPDVIAVDFETMPIRQRPEYPPEPVGVSLRWPGDKRSHYWSWGHPDGNNCDIHQGKRELKRAWDSGLPLLFHHAKFDVAVATERMGLPMPRWDRIHDTMFLAYLADPHSRAIGLKELAAELLDWPAEEKDEVVAWVLANQRMLMGRYPDLRELNKEGKPKDTIAPSKAGAWIFAAPGTLVGPYA
jgi:DNA polymerase I-like protein with 3'-5' exonuclease and polymerase domains